MKKKLISMLLCVAMVGTMLTGCGGGGSEAPAAGNGAGGAESSSGGAAGSGEEAEIYMFIASPEYADAINELIDAYKEVAPGVTINYETTQNDYPTMLKAKLNSGDVPDIFSSTSGKEIDVYKEWSYNMESEALAETIDPAVAEMMKSPADGNGLYGIAIKGNFFGMIYNKEIFETCGISEFPRTASAMEEACAKIEAAGYKPFTTGFAEWWVFKHVWQHYLDAAAANAGMDPAALVAAFEKGEAKVADYPELYDNFFHMVDLIVTYGDDKPLETALENEEAAFANGEAAMMVGQGAWVEADLLSINPDLKIGFAGYPVTEDAAQSQVISGSDQSLHVYKDSAQLQATLDFVNWWYTSDYGKTWFVDVAGVVPPVISEGDSAFEVINQGNALAAADGTASLSICYSTDSWHQTFGELMQAYIAGTADKDATCASIEEQWQTIEGAN